METVRSITYLNGGGGASVFITVVTVLTLTAETHVTPVLRIRFSDARITIAGNNSELLLTLDRASLRR